MEGNYEIKIQNKTLIIWRVISIFLLVSLITIVILYALGIGWKDKDKNKNTSDSNTSDSILSLWKEDSEPRKKLVDYVNTITSKSNSEYIPPESRIAVFDFDGTLFSETDPTYFECLLFSHRVLNDPIYKEIASEQDKATAQELIDTNVHEFPSELEMRYVSALPKIFKDMTYEDFDEYIQEYMKLPSVRFTNKNRAEGFYEPMVQVVEYLQANNFIVYIVTGSDRFIVRSVAKTRLTIPNRRIIGTISNVVASGQNNIDGLNYEYQGNDELILGGNFILENVKMNKVSLIQTEIGTKPVLCFGNSSGDYSMAKFVTTNNDYLSMAFMVCCDDLDREYGNMEKANRVNEKCLNNNWVPISMKNDWKRIYAEGVEKKL